MKVDPKSQSPGRSSSRFISRVAIAITMGVTAYCGNVDARAQMAEVPAGVSSSPKLTGWKSPVTNEVVGHLLFNELEGRTSGPNDELRWDGEGWIGTDMNRLWIKSEGIFENGSMSDGDHELLYDRPIPRLRYFDVQAGIREDLDSGPNRTWGGGH
jgi:copper resistance protein B